MSKSQTHFHSGDPRFCGSSDVARPFTMDPNRVTCPHCKANRAKATAMAKERAEAAAALGDLGKIDLDAAARAGL